MLRFSVENLVNACQTLPASLQATIRDAIEPWRVAEAKKFSQAVAAIKAVNAFEQFSPENLSVFDEILTTMLRINQLRVTFDLHNDLLELTSLYLAACDRSQHPPSFALIDVFFKGASRLLISGYDDINPAAISMQADGLRHLQIMTDFVKAPIFVKFLGKGHDHLQFTEATQASENKNFDANDLARFCISDLRGLLHTRRYEFFLARLNFTLVLLKQIPELRGELAGLAEIVTWARQLLDYGQESLDNIFACVSAYAGDLPDDFGPKLLQAWQLGESGKIPDPVIEKPFLSTDFIYLEALKAIYGDGVLSAYEEECLRNLRDFLEIAPETYQRIFQEVSALPHTTDYEFDPYVFFFSLTNKALQDGILQNTEKDLLAKVANALKLEKEAAHEIFAESIRQAQELHIKVPSAHPLKDDAVASWQASIKLRAALNNLQNAAEIRKIGEELAQQSAQKHRKEKMRSVGGINSGWDEQDTAKMLFVYEPACFELPLFIILTSDEERQTVRLKLKGEDLSLRGSAAIGQDMAILNRALDQSAPLNFAAGSDIAALKTQMQQALEESQGRYAVAVVPYPSGNPVFFKEIHGSIDFSGALGKAEILISKKNLQEACDLLQDLSQSSGDVAEVFFTLGNVHRNLAAQASGVAAEQSLEAALASYEALAKRWPDLAEGWAGIGMVKRQQEKLDEAMANLEKALRLKPVSVTNSLTYAFYGLLKYQSDPQKLLQFLQKNLEAIYNFMPMHPQIMDFLNQINAKFGIQLRALLEMTEVNSRYQ